MTKPTTLIKATLALGAVWSATFGQASGQTALPRPIIQQSSVSQQSSVFEQSTGSGLPAQLVAARPSQQSSDSAAAARETAEDSSQLDGQTPAPPAPAAPLSWELPIQYDRCGYNACNLP